MDSGAPNFDMSPCAVEARLRDLGQLYRLGMELKQYKIVGLLSDLVENQTAKSTNDTKRQKFEEEPATDDREALVPSQENL